MDRSCANGSVKGFTNNTDQKTSSPCPHYGIPLLSEVFAVGFGRAEENAILCLKQHDNANRLAISSLLVAKA